MSVDIRLTKRALADLRAIEAYIGQQSRRRATEMIANIYDRIDALASFPRLGPIVHEYDDDSIRELFEAPYRIVYQIIDEGRIDVVAVVHAARQLPDVSGVNGA